LRRGDTLKNVLSFKSKSEVIEEEKKNRIFFHDLINHTHGILLFLNQKNILEKGVTHDEVELLTKEVKLLQTLIQDHFNYQHKNLNINEQFVPFDRLHQSIEMMIKIYFDESILMTTELRGHIALFENSNTRENSIVHFSSLYRILNNLIKNMSEAHSSELHFIFDYQDDYLLIETRNNFGANNSRIDIADKLSRVILNEESARTNALGLDSIHELVQKEKGTFGFEIENNTWINKLKIPHQLKQKAKKVA
jgi:hypothetical protein